MFLPLIRMLICAVALTGGAALAQSPSASTPPSGAVLLTVTGPDGGDEMRYDLAMLQALEAASFETSTIWTDGVRRFSGVPLRVLLADLGVNSGTLRATAINNYSVEFPVAEALSGSALVAYEIDGKPMSRRDKGPLWIVYPYDAGPQYRSEVIYTRSIWQLERLQVLD